MNFREDADYRKRLASGFLNEARHNLEHKLWRSCVDNSQLSIENSCKMVIAVLEPVEKSHNPSRQLRRLAETKRFGEEFTLQVEEIAKISDRYGMEEHFMTDYGDEATLSDPWSLFDEEDAKEALGMAEQCFKAAAQILDTLMDRLQPLREAGQIELPEE